MKKVIFKGSGVAIITPMNNDGSVNYDTLGKLIEFQIENKTDAIITCGTTGESATLTEQEHHDVIKFTIEKVAKRVPVIAGTGSNNTEHALKLSLDAEKLGADALLIVTPYYNKTSQKGLIEHYTYIADRVNTPIITYCVPSRTGVTIKPETYLELSKHKNIVATKEASGNISELAKTISLCKDNLNVYSGNDDQIVPILSLGGAGVVSVLANILPEETHNICEKYFLGEVIESRNLQLKYLSLANSLFIETNPIPVKTAMNLMNFNCGPLRLPLCEMEDSNLVILEENLKANGLIK